MRGGGTPIGADRERRTAAGNREPQREKAEVNRSFGLMAVLGVLLVLAGPVGLVHTGLATLTSMVLFGWLLLIGGVVGLAQAVQSRGSTYFWLAVIVAAPNIAAGLVLLRRPEASAEALTVSAALLFRTGGLFRLVGALVVRGADVGLALVQGAFGVLLGFPVLSDWPGNSLYVIGTFFSLALLFDGLSLIAMGMGARRILGLVREDEAGTEAGPETDAARGTRETAEKRPAEDQEQTNN